MEYLAQHIESLIFTSEAPISLEEIKGVLEEHFETTLEASDLETTITQIQDRYKEEAFAFELVTIAKGYQFLTKGAYHGVVGTYLKQTTKKRLSRAALETLSIIAYKQPVIKSELERIRGVSCDYSIQKLLEKELVTISGRSEGPGRPLLYVTSEKFMDYFGLKDLKDLPKPKDFKAPDSEIGEAAPIEEIIQKVEAALPVNERLLALAEVSAAVLDALPGAAPPAASHQEEE
ncbi:MAG: SMC-Scp complex subunit ScpB [Bacteroidota bacterium]